MLKYKPTTLLTKTKTQCSFLLYNCLFFFKHINQLKKEWRFQANKIPGLIHVRCPQFHKRRFSNTKWRQDELPTKGDILSLSFYPSLPQLGQLRMALRQFWEDTHVRTTVNAWVYAESEARGQCWPGSRKKAADSNSSLSCLFLFSWWSNEILGQNTLLPPGSSPCAPLLFGSLVRAVGTSWLFFIQIRSYTQLLLTGEPITLEWVQKLC